MYFLYIIRVNAIAVTLIKIASHDTHYSQEDIGGIYINTYSQASEDVYGVNIRHRGAQNKCEVSVNVLTPPAKETLGSLTLIKITEPAAG